MRMLLLLKLELISASANSLKLNSTQSAPHLLILLKTYNPAQQITTNCGPIIPSINTISTLDNHLHAHALHPRSEIHY